MLSGRDGSSDNDLQSLDGRNKDNDHVVHKAKHPAGDTDSDSSSSDSSFSESDEAEELNRVQIKMPLELSLSDLANAIITQNQKYVQMLQRILPIYSYLIYFNQIQHATDHE